jgi:molecular chaperone DnaK (HSP70)
MVLQKLKQAGRNISVRRDQGVITVPAYFNDGSARDKEAARSPASR